MIQGPCKDCEKRHLHCHSECAEYIEFSNQCEEIRKECALQLILNAKIPRKFKDYVNIFKK